jgi:hypothetical protein
MAQLRRVVCEIHRLGKPGADTYKAYAVGRADTARRSANYRPGKGRQYRIAVPGQPQYGFASVAAAREYARQTFPDAASFYAWVWGLEGRGSLVGPDEKAEAEVRWTEVLRVAK